MVVQASQLAAQPTGLAPLVPIGPSVKSPLGQSGSFESVPRLEAAIEADPYDLSSWDARLRQAIQVRRDFQGLRSWLAASG